jgi:methenyltetrahydromethanopterin cyclohydrolase
MSNAWDELQHAVATRPLDEALQYIIYELKTDITRARAGVTVLSAGVAAEGETEAVRTIIESSLARTLAVIDHLVIDIYLPRLHPQQEQWD